MPVPLASQPFETDMKRALTEALPEYEGVDAVADELNRVIMDAANKLLEQYGNAVNQSNSQDRTGQLLQQFGASNDDQEDTANDFPEQPDTGMGDNSDLSPESDLAEDERGDGENLEEEKDESEEGEAEKEKENKEEDKKEKPEEKPEQKNQKDEKMPQDQEETPKQENGDDPLGFKEPADHPATKKADEFAPPDKNDAATKNATPSQSPAEKNTGGNPGESAAAAMLSRVRNKDKKKNATTAKKNKQGGEERPETPARYAYYVILSMCFLRDVIVITMVIPILNMMSMVALQILFPIILAALAILDRKFFIYIVAKIFGFSRGSFVKKQVQKAQQAAVKAGGSTLGIILLVLIIYMIPFTPFLVYFRGKFDKDVADGKDTGISLKDVAGAAGAPVPTSKK